MRVRVIADEIFVDDYSVATVNRAAPPSIVARFLGLLERLFARQAQDWDN